MPAMANAVSLAIGAGILANAWQLNILLRLIAESGRLSEHGPASLLQLHGVTDVLHVVDGGVPLWERQGWPMAG